MNRPDSLTYKGRPITRETISLLNALFSHIHHEKPIPSELLSRLSDQGVDLDDLKRKLG